MRIYLEQYFPKNRSRLGKACATYLFSFVHVTWVQSCETSANNKWRARAVKISFLLTFCDAFFLVYYTHF